MIRGKVRLIKNEKIYPTGPYSQEEMFGLLGKGPSQELYNMLSFTYQRKLRT